MLPHALNQVSFDLPSNIEEHPMFLSPFGNPAVLGGIIGKSLTFKKHTDNLVGMAQYKFHAPRLIRKFLTVEIAKILANAFIDSQFNCTPLL